MNYAIRSALLLMLMACSGRVQAAENPSEEWAWFRSGWRGSTKVGEWDMDRGKADIQRDGENVSGQLIAEDGPRTVMHFTGTIRGSRVMLRVVLDNTDAGPMMFTGTLHRSCYDATSGYEFVQLSWSGPTTIGLARGVWNVPRCKPLP
jgi:hypothetical protein